MEDDILQEIPIGDLQLLSDLYESHCAEAPHVYSLLKTQIAWKRKYPGLQGLTILGVSGDWLQTGTFVLVHQISCYDLFVFTLEEECKTLRRALTRTKRIDWSRELIQWYAVLSRHVPMVLEVVKELNLPLDHCTETGLWVIEKAKALQFEIKSPPEVFISKLDKSHVSIVNYHWPHRYKGSDRYISAFISMNTCYGVFLKNNANLVCWVLKNHLGQLGILQTLAEHKRKGYATLVIKMMSKDIAGEGHDPLGTVLVGNTASERIFEKLGFRRIDSCSYIECF
ncbi:hypothetical protein Trydic_g4079 [Trypoxylus dichotomus]